MLFLVALRDIIDDNGLKTFIDTNYLRNDNVAGDGEYKVKLKQVETDWQAFKDLVLGEELTAEGRVSAVFANHTFFCSQLKTAAEDIELGSLVSGGLAKFSVVTLELQPRENSWENPQEIFESMNSLGKPLSLADLVRNYILLGLDADVQSELYERYWLKMERSIPRRVSDFIRDYMQAKECRSFSKATDANTKALYASFKAMFGEEDSKALLHDLSQVLRYGRAEGVGDLADLGFGGAGDLGYLSV